MTLVTSPDGRALCGAQRWDQAAALSIWSSYVLMDWYDRMMHLHPGSAPCVSKGFDELPPGVRERLGLGWRIPARLMLRLAAYPHRRILLGSQVMAGILGVDSLNDPVLEKSAYQAVTGCITHVRRALRELGPGTELFDNRRVEPGFSGYTVALSARADRPVLIVRSPPATEQFIAEQGWL